MYETINVNNQTIFCGDCLEVMKELPDQSIDLVVTSPVYNIGCNYNTYDDNLSSEDYLQWMNNIFAQLHRLLKFDGALFLNVGGTCKEPCRAMEVCFEARKYFVLQNNIIWAKAITVGVADQSFGHFKPVNSDRFLNNIHENIFHFTKSGTNTIDRLAVGCHYQDESNISRWKHEDKQGPVNKRCRGNIWYIPYKTVKSKTEKFNHPAGFPEELVENCLKLQGIKNDMVVLDPFLGAGTTLVVCNKYNVKGMGVELDASYSNLARERISGKKEML